VTEPGPIGQVWSWFTALHVLPLHETGRLKYPQSAEHIELVVTPPPPLSKRGRSTGA